MSERIWGTEKSRLLCVLQITRDCQMRLYTTDGDVVLLDPTPYFDKDGRLPNIFQYQGRTFERGSDDRLLWFEVTEPHPESESSGPKEGG